MTTALVSDYYCYYYYFLFPPRHIEKYLPCSVIPITSCSTGTGLRLGWLLQMGQVVSIGQLIADLSAPSLHSGCRGVRRTRTVRAFSGTSVAQAAATRVPVAKHPPVTLHG